MSPSSASTPARPSRMVLPAEGSDDGSRWRMRLFFGACIPVRLLLSVAALVIGHAYPRALAVVAVYAWVTAIGFAYNLWLTMVGRKDRGGFGGSVWWRRARYVHILMWASAATAATARQTWAGWLLVGDVAVAAAAGVAHFAYGLDV